MKDSNVVGTCTEDCTGYGSRTPHIHMPNIPSSEVVKAEFRAYIKKWPEMDVLGSMDFWLEKLDAARLEGKKEATDLIMDTGILAKAHTLIFQKRRREVTLEDDAVCKCFRQVLLEAAST